MTPLARMGTWKAPAVGAHRAIGKLRRARRIQHYACCVPLTLRSVADVTGETAASGLFFTCVG